MLIDTHTHLYCEEFDDDRPAAVQRALDAGVGLMLLPAIDSRTTERQEQLVADFPHCFRQMAGLHPTSVTADFEAELSLVERQLAEGADRYVAIGEIGLDFYWDTTYREQQEEVLRRQLRLAQRYGKPVALHIRKAYDEFMQLFRQLGDTSLRGVMHCYSGSVQQAQRAVEMGFYFGIGGVLTFKNAHLCDVVRAVPLERIVLETDAPYLAPVPFRGKRNESAYVSVVAQRLAEILERPLEEICETTTANARRLFNL